MLRGLARLILRMGGWTAVGGDFKYPKAVFIAAPHTSNWDGFWALTYKVSIGVDVKFFAKKSLFWFPLGTILRALGGVPLDRTRATSAVQQAVAMFNAADSFYFGLAPEGTRSKARGWKNGFYRIATEADVPVYLGFLDYGSRRIGFGPHFMPSGDRDADLAICQDFYAGLEGRRAHLASPIVFPERRSKKNDK